MFKPENDTMKIRIEEDGTITTVTGKMSAEVHHTAEEFLNQVNTLVGGTRKTVALEHRTESRHHHHHSHVHVVALQTED